MRLLLVVCGVTVVACVGATEPNQPNCFYRGDTIAYSVVSLDHIAIVCDWTVATTTQCFTHPAVTYGQRDCKEGEKWPRH